MQYLTLELGLNNPVSKLQKFYADYPELSIVVS